MGNKNPIAIIGGYDSIAKSFYSKTKLLNNKSIFINVDSIKRKKSGSKDIYHFEIFQLRKIIETLKIHKIKKLLFLGKINRPNLSNFKSDGVIDKHLPSLINSYKEGDGKVLLTVLNIFVKKGFKILPPNKISKSFFFDASELSKNICINDKNDLDKSINLLNDLSKYDNAQSIVSINGYIIAIEAAEGTDNMLLRVASVRKQLNQINSRAGLLVKIPKKNQSKLVDLPVIGLKTLKLVKKANLNGIAINPKLTIIDDKEKFLEYALTHALKIYKI